MKERQNRHRTINRLIKSNRIESQEILLEQLHSEGFIITQATLSRDLKALKVGKISDGGTGYYYSTPTDEKLRDSGKQLVSDLLRGWVSIAFSGNIGVVKTLAGHADSAAIALENLEITGLLGTVAGDDTIILILAEDILRTTFLGDLVAKVPELKEDLA